MSARRGEVVLLSAPFASRKEAKTRPMLVVQNDTNNARMTNTIAVLITSNLSRAAQPTQVLIDPTTPEGQHSGLLRTSVISTVRYNPTSPWCRVLLACSETPTPACRRG